MKKKKCNLLILLAKPRTLQIVSIRFDLFFFVYNRANILTEATAVAAAVVVNAMTVVASLVQQNC